MCDRLSGLGLGDLKNSSPTSGRYISHRMIHLLFTFAFSRRRAWRNQLEDALANSDNHDTTFDSLLTSFLKGSGIPCPSLFYGVRDHFNSIIDLSCIDDDGFRARTFCWAATGSCERAVDAASISVSHIFTSRFSTPYSVCIDKVCRR